MMKECTAKYAEAKAPAAMRQEKNDTVASRAKEGCDEHLRSMDEERARGREELARVLEDLNRSPRGARTRKSTACNELLKRMERERTDALEREEVVRGQLNGITTLIHQQREEMAQRHKLMEERWNEKQGHREEKEARQDEFIRLARGILHDREQERAEREAEREANAGQPTIEQVLELLREQGERMQTSTDSLAEAWRADSVRQHQETIEAVRATATQMVRLDLL